MAVQSRYAREIRIHRISNYNPATIKLKGDSASNDDIRKPLKALIVNKTMRAETRVESDSGRILVNQPHRQISYFV